MRLIRAILLSGAALSTTACGVCADDLTGINGLEALDTGKLAIEAAPALPASKPAMSKYDTLSPPKATSEGAITHEILPSGASSGSPSISWSGYARTGIVYQGGN